MGSRVSQVVVGRKSTSTLTMIRKYQQYRQPHGIGGIQRLLTEVRNHHPFTSRKAVAEALQKSSLYTLYKPVRNKFKREKLFVSEIDQEWQLDLMSMHEFAPHNDGVKYLLTGVDLFSRFAYAHPLKSKEAKLVAVAIESLLQNRIIDSIQTDQGKEFMNTTMKRLMEKYEVNHFTSLDQTIKCAAVERFNRTLREKLMRYIELKGFRYIDALDDIVQAYNNTPHSAHGIAPGDVTHENCLAVYNTLYPSGYEYPKKEPKYTVGTEVRISVRKTFIEHGSTRKWTMETFIISAVIPRFGVHMYKLQDGNGEEFDASFYEEELQPVSTDRKFLWKVERVLASKKVKRTLYYKVRWKGLSSQFDSWVKT